MGKLNLSREQTIIEHRKLWNWLADQYESGKFVRKKDYFIDLEDELIPCRLCYCCDYTLNNKNDEDEIYKCYLCPVQWPDNKHCIDYDSLWRRYMKYEDELLSIEDTLVYYPAKKGELIYSYRKDLLKAIAIVARNIANLPEKEV